MTGPFANMAALLPFEDFLSKMVCAHVRECACMYVSMRTCVCVCMWVCVCTRACVWEVLPSSFVGTMDLDVASLAILQTLAGLKGSQEGVCSLTWGLGPWGHVSVPLGTSTISLYFPGYVPEWGSHGNQLPAGATRIAVAEPGKAIVLLQSHLL